MPLQWRNVCLLCASCAAHRARAALSRSPRIAAHLSTPTPHAARVLLCTVIFYANHCSQFDSLPLTSLTRRRPLQCPPPTLLLAAQVCPGPFESAPNAHVGYNVARTLQHKVPMRRFGSMGEIAALVKFIASDAAAFVTGANIPVDGGWSCQ